jgi:hypothetical protein
LAGVWILARELLFNGVEINQMVDFDGAAGISIRLGGRQERGLVESPGD